jgi:hypothetical protein
MEVIFRKNILDVKRALLLVLTFCCTNIAFGQKSKPIFKPFKPGAKEFVISYTIVVSGDKISGIAETYNGGLKTAFIRNDDARLRLVSLMRTQSIFFNNKKAGPKKVATVVKESGKERGKMFLSAKQWKTYNTKLDSISCEIFKDDTLRVLNLLCAKALITRKDSSKIIAYFYPCTKNKTLDAVEPLFAKVPGLVMQYSYSSNDKTILYTATTLKAGKILPSTFIIPTKGYKTQKYNPGAPPTSDGMNDEDDDEGTEEEENEGIDSTKALTGTLMDSTNKTPPLRKDQNVPDAPTAPKVEAPKTDAMKKLD